MPEYLSPGVYVEEYDSGGRPMAGVSTSTAGFIGLAEKGPAEGPPEFVGSFADFKRIFGGYLSQSEFGGYRFLPYAVEHFFLNGGTRCFIARVLPPGAKASSTVLPVGAAEGEAVLTVEAKNPGLWGDDVKVVIHKSTRFKTQILEKVEFPGGGTGYLAKNGSGFAPGDIVTFTDGTQRVLNTVKKSQDNIVEFETEFADDIVDASPVPQKLIVTCDVTVEVRYGSSAETYDNCSLNEASPNFIASRMARSELVKVTYGGVKAEAAAEPYDTLAGEAAELVLPLSGGSNGDVTAVDAGVFLGEDNGPGKRTGICAFVDNGVCSLMAVPGVCDPVVQLGLIAHCEKLTSRFAVLDIPREIKKVTEMTTHRDMFDTSYAAAYHPWLEVYDPLEKRNIFLPPSGPVLGIFARSDNTRGVHKAPANEGVRGCVGLDCQYNKAEQDMLNPIGINLIRAFTGQGIRVWGARTLSSNPLWKYINIRRLFIFVEESIRANMSWAVFEPNSETLWSSITRTLNSFLGGVWLSGALAGTSEGEAFYVTCDRTTMTQDDIDNGRLICQIGIAPVKPAEFVIFRITQKTAEA